MNGLAKVWLVTLIIMIACLMAVFWLFVLIAADA